MAQKNTDNRPPSPEERELFSKLKINYSKDKDEVWKSLQARTIQATPPAKVVSMRPLFLKIAASLIIVFGLGLLLRFYSIEVATNAGELLSHTLPDGSVIHLNAASEVHYHPFWWKVDRKITFEGEAYFEVAEGKKFTVISNDGSTEVLGTSFNIFAREDQYQVYCTSGKVKVTSIEENTAFLTKGEFVETTQDGQLVKDKTQIEQQILSWRFNKFIYNTTPLRKVFKDLSRHYGIEVIADNDQINEHFYTGLFSRDVSAEQALQIICYSFDLEFRADSTNVYTIR